MADVDQRAGDDPHHVVQKGVPGDGQKNLFPRPFHPDLRDGAHGRLRAAAGGGESREIMCSQQHPAGLVHPPIVEPDRNVGREVAVQGAGVGAVVDLVAVGLPADGKTGVQAVRHPEALQHPDVSGQHGVEGKGELFRRDAGRAIQMGALAQGVDARVRPAGPGDPHRPAQQLFQRFFQHLLDRKPVLLPLPAHVVRTVVGDGQKKTL